MPPWFDTWPPWAVLWGHVLIALIWTTPWDNYLVATRVWWYDPALVTGLTLGWVPIEEYTFFVVQTLMAGLWLLAWMRRLPAPRAEGQQETLRRAYERAGISPGTVSLVEAHGTGTVVGDRTEIESLLPLLTSRELTRSCVLAPMLSMSR